MEDKLEKLLAKIIGEFENLIIQYNKGHSDINYSMIFEELQFLRLLSMGSCISDSYINSIIEYYLTNDYKVRRIW